MSSHWIKQVNSVQSCYMYSSETSTSVFPTMSLGNIYIWTMHDENNNFSCDIWRNEQQHDNFFETWSLIYEMVCNLYHLQCLFPKSNGTKFQCISSTGRVVSNYQNLSNKLYFPTRHFKHTQRAFLAWSCCSDFQASKHGFNEVS